MTTPRATLAVAALALLLLAAASAIGGTLAELPARLAALAFTLVKSGVPAAAYILGSVGVGRLARPLWRRAENPWPLQAALGLALTLTLSHALGALGLLTQLAALAPVGLGLVLLAHQLAAARAAGDIEPRIPPAAALALFPAAVLLVAACQPPGWLWQSEAGGYDALSYHLMLPREWVEAGRIAPLTHNVYSYLPSSIESAFTHLAIMCGSRPAAPGERFPDLLASEGWLLTSCQLLHAGLTLLAAWIVARAATAACAACGTGREPSRRAGALAGCLFLATPWTVVVGSLAYNEMGMIALGAAAMLAALDRGISGTGFQPVKRGVLVGLLVGASCSCKPTAILFFAPAAAILLLIQTRPRDWLVIFSACAAAGFLMLAPWLLRNFLHGGNPVFPAVASVFGSAHWSAEQVARYHAAHSFDGSLLDRLRLLILPGDDPRPLLSAHRGLLHPQWFIFFPAALICIVHACAAPATRRLALALAAILALQLAAWLVLTHLQSRFLIPLAVPACMAAALATAARASRHASPRAALALIILIQAGATVYRFACERGGHPSALLIAGPGIMTGELWDAPPAPGAATPPVDLNLNPPPGRIYLLGSATPLYFAAPVLYNTTWDTWPLATAIRAHPDDPSRWSASLPGLTWILVDPAELDRLTRSGYTDPDVTPQRMGDWLGHHANPVIRWPGGQTLYQLVPP